MQQCFWHSLHFFLSLSLPHSAHSIHFILLIPLILFHIEVIFFSHSPTSFSSVLFNEMFSSLIILYVINFYFHIWLTTSPLNELSHFLFGLLYFLSFLFFFLFHSCFLFCLVYFFLWNNLSNLYLVNAHETFWAWMDMFICICMWIICFIIIRISFARFSIRIIMVYYYYYYCYSHGRGNCLHIVV